MHGCRTAPARPTGTRLQSSIRDNLRTGIVWFFDGPICEAERTEGGCATSQDLAPPERSRNKDAKRTPGGEAVRSGGAAGNKEIGAATPTTAVTCRARSDRLRSRSLLHETNPAPNIFRYRYWTGFLLRLDLRWPPGIVIDRSHCHGSRLDLCDDAACLRGESGGRKFPDR